MRWPRGLISYFGRPVPTLAVLAVAITLIGGCTPREPAAPLNLVVNLVDTLRADHLHYHGYARETSPRIDALAGRSSVFLQHHSTSSRTGPSTASMRIRPPRSWT